MSTLTPFLCLKDNRYSFEDDSKEPKIDLSRFGWCFEIEKGWRASPYSWIQSVILNNHLSLHNQQRRECPSFWLDGHLPPSGNHTILLLERIPHFNFPNSVIYDQVPFPDLLRTTKRSLWLLWPLPAIFSSSWREFSPSLIALNPLSSAFHRRIKGSG